MSLNHKDTEFVKKAILPWLRRRLPAAKQIDMPVPVAPAAGGSSETFFIDPVVRDACGARQENWVLRIEPTVHRIYQHAGLEKQYRVMKILGEAGAVPVPRVLWYEDNPSVLGAPFFLMERVQGDVPDGFYHSRGLLAEANPAERERIWLSALGALAAIHGADPALFGFLRNPAEGATGLDQEISVWREYSRWCGFSLTQVEELAWRWLGDHMPDSRPTGLAWGDARFANMVFSQGECRAVIDWETASLGGAETDLGWWLFFDWYVSEGVGVPRLAGLPGPEDMLAVWEQLSGRKTQAMEWHQAFATLRYSMIRNRARYLAAKRSGSDYQPCGPEDLIQLRLIELMAG